MKEPKIRFKGFKGEWEETSLGKLSTNYKYGINAAAIPYDGTNKYLRITDIDENTRLFSQEDLTSPGTDLSCCNEYLLEEGDITIARTGASVGKSYIYHLSDGKVYFAGFLIRTRLNENVDKDYVFYSTLTDKYAKYIRLVSQRSGQPGVNVEELKGYTFNLPCDKAEQQSIASYFQHLDYLIQSTTKKIESLKQVKAASLQSMFPQEGETTPRVRFKGFEEEWEIVTLGEVGTFKSNGVDKLIKPNEKIINLLNYLDVYNSRQVTKDNCNSLMQVSASDRQIKECDIQKNDVFFTPSSETAEDIGYVLVMRDTLPNTCYSYHLMRYRPNEGVFFEDFPNCGFMTKFVRAQIRLLAKGVQRFVIGKTEFESIKVQIPSYKEQMQIANFFRSLDHQITLQNQRLEKLKQIKAACLDNMFV